MPAACAPPRSPPRATWPGCPSTPAPRSMPAPKTSTPWRTGSPNGCAGGARPSATTAVPVWNAVEVSAEKGYLREFGNIVFHFSLLGLLVAVAVGKLFGYEGNVIVIADGGPGFCSASPAAFDSFRAGNTVDGTSLHPICIRVNDFQAHYLPSGQATSFAADIDYQAGNDLSGQQLAALPARGQPPAAGRRRPGVPAGPRLRTHLHRHVPGRADTHVDRAVATRQSADPALVGCGAYRSARRQLSRRRRAPQARDRDPGPAGADRAARRHPAVVAVPGSERPRGGHRHLPRRHRPGQPGGPSRCSPWIPGSSSRAG